MKRRPPGKLKIRTEGRAVGPVDSGVLPTDEKWRLSPTFAYAPYMLEATLTSKGQVTIPVEVRRALGLKTADRLIVRYDEESGSLTMFKVLSPRELAARTSKLPRSDVPPVMDADAYYQAHRDDDAA